MKNADLTASVRHNSNKVISSSHCDWSGIRSGSFIRFSNDEVFYNVYKITKITIVKDFEIINEKQLSLQSDVSYIVQNDKIIISYKQFKLNTLLAIPNGGKGYLVGDRIYAQGGSPWVDPLTNDIHCARFVVSETGEVGNIVQVNIEDYGSYLRCPSSSVCIGGGNGKDAILELDFTQNDIRGKLERRVEWVDPDQTKQIVKVDYPLPKGLTKGNITLEKWEMILTGPYLGESSLSVSYDVCRDVTPYASLPLIVRNSAVLHLLHNKALMLIDTELNKLNQQIMELKQSLDQVNRPDVSLPK